MARNHSTGFVLMVNHRHLSLFPRVIQNTRVSFVLVVVSCAAVFLCASHLPVKANKDHPSWSEINNSIKRTPADFHLWIKKGDAELNALDDDAALKDFTEAIRLAPNSTEGYIHRSDLYRHLGKFDKAEQDGKKALEIAYALPQPANADVVRDAAGHLAHLDALRGDLKSCLAIYEKLYEKFHAPKDAIELGIYNFKLKRYDVAQKNLELGLQTNPREFESLGVLAECYEMQHKYKEALKTYTKAIDIIKEEHRNFLTHHRYLLLEKRGAVEKVLGDEKAAAQDIAAARSVRDGIFEIVPFRSSMPDK